jgi:hypothetical protein
MLFGASVRNDMATFCALVDIVSVTVPHPANTPEHCAVEAFGKLQLDETITPPEAVTVGPTPVSQVTKVVVQRGSAPQPVAEDVKGNSPW